MKIYSKVEKDTLLHIISKADDIVNERHDITPENYFLQVGAMRLNNNRTFLRHKHIKNERHTDETHESWIVIKGKIKGILYDLDNTLIHEEILGPGDCIITLKGGHNWLCLEDDSLAYEFKNGPYKGNKADKELF